MIVAHFSRRGGRGVVERARAKPLLCFTMTTRPRTDTTVRRPGPLKRQAVKAKKLALQLVPRDDVLRERVRARGQNPNVT